MLRCMGAAEPGAVFVEGGADHVMPPRLPKELPPPRRASASPGARAKASTAQMATTKDVRRIVVRFSVSMRAIWCGTGSGASHGHAVYPDRRRVRAAAEPQVVGRRQMGEDIQQIAGDGDLGHRLRQRT